MISDMLKTSAALPAQGAGDRIMPRANESGGYSDEFAAVLAQVSAAGEQTAGTSSPQRTNRNSSTEQAQPPEQNDTTQAHEKYEEGIQSEKDSSVKDSSEKEPVKERQVDGKTGDRGSSPQMYNASASRLKALAERLTNMEAMRRVAKLEADKEEKALSGNEGNVNRQRDGRKTKALKQREASAMDSRFKQTVRPGFMKGVQQSVIKQGAIRTAQDGEMSPSSETGTRLRAAKMSSLRRNRASSDVQSNLNNMTVHLKNETQSAFSSKAKADAPGLAETVLSKYEGSVKIVDAKPHYQTVQNADGLIGDSNFDEIVRQFTLLMRKGGGEAKLLLQPEHLGSMKLRIQLDRGEVATSILVDNQAAKDLILSKLNILEESLLERGFDLGSFDVGVKSENGDSEAPSGTAGGKNHGSSGDVLISMENEDESGHEEARLPWMSTRVNITV
jgi:flagellar hook-length control protein FliK